MTSILSKRTQAYALKRARDYLKRAIGPSTFEMFGASTEKMAFIHEVRDNVSRFVDNLSDNEVLEVLACQENEH